MNDPEPTTAWTIREAGPGDAPTLARLIRELAIYEKLEHAVRGTAADLAQYLGGPGPLVEALLAERGGEAVGFALFFYTYSTFEGRPSLYLEDIFVEPVHRGAGIGKALFGAVAERAVSRGCGRMEWAVLDWNAPAIAFYRARGAVPLDDWTTFRLDAEALGRLVGPGAPEPDPS
jgi:GNAT superfamily N-acetyltransferase